jgi:hypothetical protein
MATDRFFLIFTIITTILSDITNQLSRLSLPAPTLIIENDPGFLLESEESDFEIYWIKTKPPFTA